MAVYILVTKFSPELMKDIKKREELGQRWREAVHRNCPSVRFKDHYAILGRYDFIDIFEADNEEEAAKVALISMVHGATFAETWTAIPYKRFLDIVRDLKE